MNIVQIFPYFWYGGAIRRSSWADGAYMYMDDNMYVHRVVKEHSKDGDVWHKTSALIAEPIFAVDDIDCDDWEQAYDDELLNITSL